MATKDGEEGRGGLIVDAFVQSVNDDDTRNVGRGEGIHNQVVELGNERVLCYGGFLFDHPNDLVSKGGVPTCELVPEGGKDVFELLPVEVIPRAEETGTEDPSLCDHPGKCLGDGGFSCSCQSVKPEDVPVPGILSPSHYLIEDGLSSPGEAGIVVAGLVSGVVHRIQLL